MTLHYVTRDDKNANRLTTSYDTAEKAKKYGTGENQKFWTGFRYVDDNGKLTNEDNGYIVRSVLNVSGEQKHSEGNFVIYHKDEDDNWVATQHRYTSYGLANTAMKSFAGVYFDMLVVEEPKNINRSEPSDEPAPF